MLKIWGRANSINVHKVLWCCGELGLQYDRIDAGNEFGVTKTPQYRVLNPNGLVPAIEDDDLQLWESNVIVRYLAQKSGHGRLYPADIKTRFDAERWMDWQTTVFWPSLRPLFIELIRTPPAKRDATVISRAESLSLAAVHILDARLSDRTFLAGESFSMGDIPAATTVHRWYALDIHHPELPNHLPMVSIHERTSVLSGHRHDAFELALWSITQIGNQRGLFRRLKRPQGRPLEQGAGQEASLRARDLRASNPRRNDGDHSEATQGLRRTTGHGPQLQSHLRSTEWRSGAP
jgi:glutathione S-transferase